jgi:predicted phosphodiesterase
MKLAVFSDIHGSATALDAVLDDIARTSVDQLVCLGDCIQGGPQPGQVVARLRGLGCPVVMGNADSWLFTGAWSSDDRSTDERRRMLEDVRSWTVSRLSAADRAFIQAFSPTVALDVGGRSFLGYHGSPDSFDDILMPDMPRERFDELLGPHAADFMAGGHVHLQFQRTLGNGSLHFNPGSVGESYDRTTPEVRWKKNPWAEYAVLECDGGRVGIDFRRVPYDVPAYVAALRESGRPHAEQAIQQLA